MNIYALVESLVELKKTLKFFYFNFRGIPSVVVISHGKVWSEIILKSVTNSYKGPIIALNDLHDNHINNRARLIFKQLKNHRGRVKLIIVIQKPIFRNISNFLQQIDLYCRQKVRVESLSISELNNLFLLYYPHFSFLDWYGASFTEITGIDIYEEPFPASGSKKIKNSKIECLILKSSIAMSRKKELLTDFLNMETLYPLEPFEKVQMHHKEYNKMRESLNLPDNMNSNIMDSKYVKHFFSGPPI